MVEVIFPVKTCTCYGVLSQCGTFTAVWIWILPPQKLQTLGVCFCPPACLQALLRFRLRTTCSTNEEDTPGPRRRDRLFLWRCVTLYLNKHTSPVSPAGGFRAQMVPASLCLHDSWWRLDCREDRNNTPSVQSQERDVDVSADLCALEFSECFKSSESHSTF